MLRICAAAATPCAWLPEENATTPPPRASCGIDDSLLKAPRNLNEPVRCSISGFRNTLAPTRSLEHRRRQQRRSHRKGRDRPGGGIDIGGTDGQIGAEFGHARSCIASPEQTGKARCSRRIRPRNAAASGTNSTASARRRRRARISAMLSMKARAEASQVCRAANSRQACARDLQRREASRLQIVVQHADRRGADHVARTGHRETPPPAGRWPAPPAAPGRTCRSCSETRRRRRRHRSRASSSPCRAPRNTACGYLRASAARAGPSPTISLVPGRSRSRNASRFFSTATRPTQRNTGRGRPRSTSRG